MLSLWGMLSLWFPKMPTTWINYLFIVLPWDHTSHFSPPLVVNVEISNSKFIPVFLFQQMFSNFVFLHIISIPALEGLRFYKPLDLVLNLCWQTDCSLQWMESCDWKGLAHSSLTCLANVQQIVIQHLWQVVNTLFCF